MSEVHKEDFPLRALIVSIGALGLWSAIWQEVRAMASYIQSRYYFANLDDFLVLESDITQSATSNLSKFALLYAMTYTLDTLTSSIITEASASASHDFHTAAQKVMEWADRSWSLILTACHRQWCYHLVP